MIVKKKPKAYDPSVDGTLTIALGSPKGGPGKTTLSVAIAAELGRRYPGPVRLADLDYTANASKHVSRGIGKEDGIKVHAEHLFSLVDDHRVLANKLASMAEGAQFLVLDTPGAFENRGAQTCMQVADILIIPMTPSMYDMEATLDALYLLEKVAAMNPEQLQVVVINRPAKTKLGMQIQQVIEAKVAELNGVVLAKTAIRQSVGLQESVVEGKPVWTLGSSGRNPTDDISALCDEILGVYMERKNG